MTKKEFYKQLEKTKFTRIVTIEGHKTDYFFIDLPRVRVVFNKWNSKYYGLYVRDVKDDNFINNLLLKTFKKLDEKTMKLFNFMTTMKYQNLSANEKFLLGVQYNAMCIYSSTLFRRINLYKQVNKFKNNGKDNKK